MESNNATKLIIAFLVMILIFKTCSDRKDDKQSDRKQQNHVSNTSNWQKSPIDEMVKQMSSLDNFSIILYDMDAQGQDSNSPRYKHQYRVVIEKPDTVLSDISKWHTVSSSFFEKHIDNLGMEIVSKKDGVLHKQATPAGYTNYVGNPKYGQWEQRNGSSFWSFYGKYAFMSSMFNMMAYPARRSYYSDYHDNYYRSGRPYYGSNGQSTYGTKSYTNSTSGKNSTWAKKPSSFKSSVRSKVAQSNTKNTSRSYSSSKSYSKPKPKTTRSSSRSSSSSSYRSRSGGYGK